MPLGGARLQSFRIPSLHFAQEDVLFSIPEKQLVNYHVEEF